MTNLFFIFVVLSKRASNPLKPIRPAAGAPLRQDPPVPTPAQREHNTVFAPLTKLLYGTPESRANERSYIRGPSTISTPSGVMVDEFRRSGPELSNGWKNLATGSMARSSRFSIPLTDADVARNLARGKVVEPQRKALELQRQARTLPHQIALDRGERTEAWREAVQQGGFAPLEHGGFVYSDFPDAPPFPMPLKPLSPGLAAIPEMREAEAAGESNFWPTQRDTTGVARALHVIGPGPVRYLNPNTKIPLPEHAQTTPQYYDGIYRNRLRPPPPPPPPTAHTRPDLFAKNTR